MTESAGIEEICRRVLPRLSPVFRNAGVAAFFYPFVGLTHTMRRRGATWVVRISDHCRDAPPDVLEAVVVILAFRVLRKRPPAAAVEAYDRYRLDPQLDRRVRERRLLRGRKLLRDARGTCHSLEEIFRDLNRRYFNGQVEVGRLGWGARRSWSRLGHYDPVHHAIAISPVLDAAEVPRTVVEYLLYHEMLHILFDGQETHRRNRHHTPAFSKAEKAFPHYAAAKEFLERYCSTRGRRSRFRS
jgi:hypothetical protein